MSFQPNQVIKIFRTQVLKMNQTEFSKVIGLHIAFICKLEIGELKYTKDSEFYTGLMSAVKFAPENDPYIKEYIQAVEQLAN